MGNWMISSFYFMYEMTHVNSMIEEGAKTAESNRCGVKAYLPFTLSLVPEKLLLLA